MGCDRDYSPINWLTLKGCLGQMPYDIAYAIAAAEPVLPPTGSLPSSTQKKYDLPVVLFGGCDRDWTCDPYRVKVMLSRWATHPKK